MLNLVIDALRKECGLVVIPKIRNDKTIHLSGPGVEVSINEKYNKENGDPYAVVTLVNRDSCVNTVLIISKDSEYKDYGIHYLVKRVLLEKSEHEVSRLEKELIRAKEINSDLKAELEM